MVGWWTGYKIGGLASLVSADILQKQGIEITEQKIMELYLEWKAGDFNLSVGVDL